MGLVPSYSVGSELLLIIETSTELWKLWHLAKIFEYYGRFVSLHQVKENGIKTASNPIIFIDQPESIPRL